MGERPIGVRIISVDRALIALRSSAVVQMCDGKDMRRLVRTGVVVLALLGALIAIASPGVATASTFAQDSADEFDSSEAQGTVDTVRRALIGIAIGTGVMLVLYIWHTDPRRRFGVASRRRERQEVAQRIGLEDEFVLPGEIEDLDPG